MRITQQSIKYLCNNYDIIKFMFNFLYYFETLAKILSRNSGSFQDTNNK